MLHRTNLIQIIQQHFDLALERIEAPLGAVALVAAMGLVTSQTGRLSRMALAAQNCYFCGSIGCS